MVHEFWINAYIKLYFKIKRFFFFIEFICFCLLALISKTNIDNTTSLHISKEHTNTSVILPVREWVTGGGRSHFQGWERNFWEMLQISLNSLINGKVKPLQWHFFILCICSLLQIWVVNMKWLNQKKNPKILWILSLLQTRNISSHKFNNNHQDKIIYYKIKTRHKTGKRRTMDWKFRGRTPVSGIQR